ALVADAPRERARGKEGPLMVRAEHARAITPPGEREDVLVGDDVLGAAEVGQNRGLADAAAGGRKLRAGAEIEDVGDVGREVRGVALHGLAVGGLDRETGQRVQAARPDLA